MPGRSFSGTNGYRYGFNGKENDSEVKGIKGSQQDYGMRIYDPRLGRFLSVDPLAREFAWNSTYAFAENDVISCIDLDGSEKLKVTDIENPSDGKPGKAKITITLDYEIITQGAGAIPSGKINATKFTELYKKGNTSMYMKTLPSETQEATYLTSGEIMRVKDDLSIGLTPSIEYYYVDIEYQYTIHEGTTMENALNFYNSEPSARGIVFFPITDNSALMSYRDGSIIFLNNKAKEAFKNPLSGGISGNETFAGVDFNYIILNPNFEGTLTLTARTVHESGHNSAGNHAHQTGDYEYNQKGLQSNDEKSIYPTEKNTKNILKDKTNRKTLKK